MNFNPEYEEYDEEPEPVGLSISQMEEVAYANMLSMMSETDSTHEAPAWLELGKGIMHTRMLRQAGEMGEGYGN